jgi:hypothetical protein
MSETFAQYGASYVASYFGQNAVVEAVAYVAILALEQYAMERIARSLAGTSKPKGEGRGLEVMITDTGAAGFAIYGIVRVGGTNAIPV